MLMKPIVQKIVQQKTCWSRSEEFIGQTVEVLVEKVSKKSTEEFSGRNSQSHSSLQVTLNVK
jgi:tRNA A37 methylthiotransferase MiaB